MPDKNNRILLYLNNSPSKFSKKCKFDGKDSKYSRMNNESFEDQVTQNTVWVFFWLGIMSGKLIKFAGHLKKFAGFVRQTDGFSEDCAK